MSDIEDLLPGMYADVPEVLRELFHRLPFGEEITLANGRKGRFVKLSEPRIMREQWVFGVDFRFDSGSPDHLEFYLKHTGGGGFTVSSVMPAEEPAQ